MTNFLKHGKKIKRIIEMTAEEIVTIRVALNYHVIMLEERLNSSVTELGRDMAQTNLEQAKKALEIALRMS